MWFLLCDRFAPYTTVGFNGVLFGSAADRAFRQTHFDVKTLVRADLLYLAHGFSGDEEGRRRSLGIVVDHARLIVAMPETA